MGMQYDPYQNSKVQRGVHRAMSLTLPSNSLDLPQVQQVVARVQTPKVFDAFLAALGVNADPFQILWRHPVDEAQVRPPQHVERRQRLCGIGLVVPQPLGPEILVVARDGWTVLRENQPNAPAPHQVRVGEVLEHLRYRPLPRLLWLLELRRWQAVDRAPQRGRRVAENGHRILRSEEVEDGTDVCGRLAGGAARRIGEDRHGAILAPRASALRATRRMDGTSRLMTEYPPVHTAWSERHE